MSVRKCLVGLLGMVLVFGGVGQGSAEYIPYFVTNLGDLLKRWLKA